LVPLVALSQRSRDDHYIAVYCCHRELLHYRREIYTVRFTLDRNRWTATALGDLERQLGNPARLVTGDACARYCRKSRRSNPETVAPATEENQRGR
jgi:hypothetical protein